MRNLSIASTSSCRLSSGFPCSNPTINAEDDSIYVLFSEQYDGPASDTIASVVRKMNGSEAVDIARVFTKGSPLSCQFLGESQALIICSSGGDIGQLPMEDAITGQPGQFEVIGSIESGICSVAWSPDETLLAIVTGEEKYILMSSSFDVLVEGMLQTEELGEDQQVNVGWGSKQTQFHGSLGKFAAQASSTPLEAIGCSPDDDAQPRISWRGDGALFTISILQKARYAGSRDRRIFRVYDRQGILQSTSEPVAGLEHVLSWRPSGNLIASSQRFGFDGGGAGRPDRHDIVFFEKNGLRHGEFHLRETGKYRVRELSWSSDSEVLAVWIERDEYDSVQLWTIGNYHWYLKQELRAPGGAKLTSVLWHPEKAMRLCILSSQTLIQYNMAWETYVARADAPNDSGTVAVIDGASLLVTPFRMQNVPPPMSSVAVGVEDIGFPVHLSFSVVGDMMAVLHQRGTVSSWKMQTQLSFGKQKVVDPIRISVIEGNQLEDAKFRQIQIQAKPSSLETFRVVTLATSRGSDVLTAHKLSGSETEKVGCIELPGSGGRLIGSETGIYWQSSDGAIFSISSLNEDPNLVASFPIFCFTSQMHSYEGGDFFVGRSDTGKLFCVDAQGVKSCTLVTNSTSFIVAAGFLIYTTASHEVFFIPTDAICSMLQSDATKALSEDHRERRRIERGARIVTAVPSNMSLVLQMPRGNLETINPRPLVLAVVRNDITRKQFRKAFLACRKHRIDFTIFVEQDPDMFLENLKLFIDQVHDVDHINLFLTSIGQSSLEPERVSRYCDAIRQVLEERSIIQNVYSILTAYVVKKPADYEAALMLLLRIRDQNSELVEDAVKYIIFLVDADKLFDTALGMYDFSLVLLIAQHSQRSRQDPREYLPFLRGLRTLPKFIQQHKIDDHLKRFSKALADLHLAGPEHFDEAIAYIEKHRLFADGLSLWKQDKPSYLRILSFYGEHVFERRHFARAASIFLEAQKADKAMISFERALLWREALELAGNVGTDKQNMLEMVHRLADELLSKKRYEEASRIFLDYTENTRLAINSLVQGNLFSEARRIAQMRGKTELVEEIIFPGLLDSRAQITEDIQEMQSQLSKQTDRIRELRIKKIEEPDAFYGVEDDPALHDVDVMTDASMAPTAFTRYTIAASTTSKSSKRSSRSKRKMERKVGSGRKGTIDEEEYLLTSIGKLITRLNTMEVEASALIPHLLRATDEHRKEARNLQEEVLSIRKEFEEALNEIWPSKGNEQEGIGQLIASTWAERMEEKKRERENAVNAIAKPSISKELDELELSIFDI